MHIQYYGLSCLKVTTKPGGRGAEDVAIVLNPFTRTADLTPPQLANADIVIATKDAPEYYSDIAKNTDALKVTMPGEYAMHGVHIVGVALPYDERAVQASLFVIESEGLKIAVVTGTDVPLKARQFEELDSADIVVIAVGGSGVFDATQAMEIVRKVEPSYVIPVHYALSQSATTGRYAPLDAFCATIGTCPKESVQKIVIRDKDCEEGAMTVVRMAP